MEVLGMVREIKNRGLCYLELVNLQKLLSKTNSIQFKALIKSYQEKVLLQSKKLDVLKDSLNDQKEGFLTKKEVIYSQKQIFC